jgi:hypothetical protein
MENYSTQVRRIEYRETKDHNSEALYLENLDIIFYYRKSRNFLVHLVRFINCLVVS